MRMELTSTRFRRNLGLTGFIDMAPKIMKDEMTIIEMAGLYGLKRAGLTSQPFLEEEAVLRLKKIFGALEANGLGAEEASEVLGLEWAE